MNVEKLTAELKSVDTLVADGVISKEKGDEWKARIIAEFEGTEIPQEKKKEMPGDIAHLPGRMIGGAIKILGNINGARCAGVDEYGDAPRKKRSASPQEMMDNLPPQYK